MWHVSNELGCHNVHCYCEVSAEAFRGWLRERYGDLDRLNDAWGTTFWSQHYGDWAEINPPRTVTAFANPTQQLDFLRFSSDELRAQLRAEREVLKTLVRQPITTNFMIGMGVKHMDYQSWADDVDLVSNDHYLTAADPQAHLGWRSPPTTPGRRRRRSVAADGALHQRRPMAAAQRGQAAWATAPQQSGARRPRADGVLFFQWRASRAGAEKFHSALVPHAGPNTKVFREVCQLGADLKALAEVRGSRWTPTSRSSSTGRRGGASS
ncbi:beta-galactosidase [Micromonospora sp. M12]